MKVAVAHPQSQPARPVEVLFPRAWPIFAGAAALLSLAAWANRGALNADAIAYLRIAGYYTEGRLDLAVSGYWGPLLSWLLVPLVKLGIEPLAAGRVVMAGTAVVFLAGVWAVLKGFANAACRADGEATMLTPAFARLGLVLAAGAVVSWSVEYISPDLLQAGLWLLGLAILLDDRWAGEVRRAALAGALFGIAYLAKSVALPLTFATVTGLWLWRWFRDRAAARASWRSLAVTLGVTLLVAGPWIMVLSVKYGRPTFSTSARIAHAVVGPDETQRSHPFGRTFHRPAAGRVTAWEDPSNMPYRYWSPFESTAAFWHQLTVCRDHARVVLDLWRSFDVLLLGTLACLYSALIWARTRPQPLNQPWLRATIPLAALSLLYLPVYLQPVDQRYLYAAWPLLYVLAGGAFGLATRRSQKGGALRRWFPWVAGFSFGLPALLGLAFALTGYPNPAAEAAADLAGRLQRAGVAGPVAGSGMLFGGRTGLYTAYLIGQPWLGDEPRANADRYAASGARLVIVLRGHPVTGQLAASPHFADLDPRLFPSRQEAEGYPLQVFERRTDAAAPR